MNRRAVGQVAMVTGAARGIGRAAALRLAREGVDVVVVDRLAAPAAATAAEIRGLGRRALDCPFDLARIAGIPALVTRTVEEFGRIDILVNVAGVLQTKPFAEVTEEDWDRIIDVNQKSLVFLIQAVAERMLAQVPPEVRDAGQCARSYGRIVNFSSISGRRGRALQVHYAASKAAVISITQSAALAYAPFLNVNAVCPGVVPTAMWEQNDREKSRLLGIPPGESMREFIERTPLRRAGTPEDMAAAVAFLCSADADFITGQTLNVDGGFEMN
ncbi:MAG: glucose 1-dehydrogenase [Lentisphaeria bacterium]|nr:glucose 1-dehydrogenase [Lentisphaeria bacterium]